MNRQRLGFQRWHRIAFLACNLGGIVLIILALAPIYDFLAERDVLIAQQSDTLGRFQSIAALEGEVQAASRQPEEQQDRGEFLSGPNEAIIGADLQTRLKAIAEHSGVRIRTMQGQPARSSGTLRYIGAQITITGNIQRIRDALYEIESGKPYLFITNASLKLVPSATSSEEPVIEAGLDVAGALATSGTSP
jgi:general secretion pathway protein M